MGYRSDVHLFVDKYTARAVAKAIKDNRLQPVDAEELENCIYFRWYSIKWYDFDEDIQSVIGAYEKGKYRIIEIGEDCQVSEYTNDYNCEITEAYVVCDVCIEGHPKPISFDSLLDKEINDVI